MSISRMLVFPFPSGRTSRRGGLGPCRHWTPALGILTAAGHRRVPLGGGRAAFWGGNSTLLWAGFLVMFVF